MEVGWWIETLRNARPSKLGWRIKNVHYHLVDLTYTHLLPILSEGFAPAAGPLLVGGCWDSQNGRNVY